MPRLTKRATKQSGCKQLTLGRGSPYSDKASPTGHTSSHQLNVEPNDTFFRRNLPFGKTPRFGSVYINLGSGFVGSGQFHVMIYPQMCQCASTLSKKLLLLLFNSADTSGLLSTAQFANLEFWGPRRKKSHQLHPMGEDTMPKSAWNRRSRFGRATFCWSPKSSKSNPKVMPPTCSPPELVLFVPNSDDFKYF